jgi:phosphate:Na+ symporter
LHDFNSQIASVCYPILYRNGQLLETRLIERMDQAPGTDKPGQGK